MTAPNYEKEVEILNAADRRYWIENKPVMPDAEFDKRLDALKKYELAAGVNNPASPTQRLGGGLIPGFKKATHVTPCLSLDNVFNLEDLEAKLQGIISYCDHAVDPGKTITWSAEPKIDGLSTTLCYEKGLLVRAITRGNGIIGDDITENCKTIRSIPLTLNTATIDRLWVRGEVFMTFKTFNKLNAAKKEAGETLLANPRNAAAGALKLLDSREVSKRGLSFIPYWADFGDYTPAPLSQIALREQLQRLGFEKLTATGDFSHTQDLLDYVVKFEAIKARLEFPVDGCVIKLGTLALRRHFPDGSKSVRWAWAYKYAPDQIETKLMAITFQVGRTGIIAPVAELCPVDVAGTTVSRASLHNEDNVEALDLRIGDTVVIQKAGSIIPEVVKSLPEERTGQEQLVVWPKTCPSCGTKIQKVTTEDGEGSAWQCPGDECPAKLQGSLEHWCSKQAMDVQDVGPSAIEKLTNSGVKDVVDLYDVTYETLLALPGFSFASATKALNAIGESKGQGLERVLIGLGINRLGAGSAKRLCKHFKNWDALVGASSEALLAVEDFGVVNLREFRHWSGLAVNIELMKRLKAKGVNLESKSYNPNAKAGSLAGKTFVFTGTLSTLGREHASRMVEEKGGRTSGSVSKKTTYLVAGEDCGSKLEKAKLLGVTVLSEVEFIKMMQEN